MHEYITRTSIRAEDFLKILVSLTSFSRSQKDFDIRRYFYLFIFSLPGQSPGRAIVLPPALALAAASALAKSLTLKFFM